MHITLCITSIVGRESDGPASNRASAGPWLIPEVNRPCRIGTSVSVAKYIIDKLKPAMKYQKSSLAFFLNPVCQCGYGWKFPLNIQFIIDNQSRCYHSA